MGTRTCYLNVPWEQKVWHSGQGSNAHPPNKSTKVPLFRWKKADYVIITGTAFCGCLFLKEKKMLFVCMLRVSEVSILYCIVFVCVCVCVCEVCTKVVCALFF